MHIGFLTSEYPPLSIGGIGTSIQNLARALVARGHRVTVLGFGASAEFDDRGVHVRFVPYSAPPRLGWLMLRRTIARELRQLVRDERLDLVEVPDWCGPSAGVRPQCPVVVRCHGSAVYFGHLLNERVRRPVAWAERVALHQAHAVAAVSRFTGDVTRALFGLRAPVDVLHNGIDASAFDASGAWTEADTIAHLGTIVRKKGVLDVCRMFTRVVERRPAARLVVVGRDSPDRLTGAPSTWALCQAELSPAAARRTEYLGELPYHTVHEVLRRAAVCVYPSYAEALGNAWVEAMCSAKPVVAYDIGWAPEVVAQDETGVLVPRGDVDGGAAALVDLLDDAARRRQMGEAGRRRAEVLFDAPVAAAQSEAWYRRVLAAA